MYLLDFKWTIRCGQRVYAETFFAVSFVVNLLHVDLLLKNVTAAFSFRVGKQC